MSDIFVSYASEDRDRIEPLVRLLEGQGWSVWWDRQIVPGDEYEHVIEQAIIAARCVVVVWTEHSIASDWVQAEAGDGMDRGILIPVMLESVRLPLAFRRRQAARLLGWPKRRDEDEVQRFLRAVEARLHGKHIELGEPGQTRTTKRPWRVYIGVATLLVAATIGTLFLWSPGIPGADGRPVVLAVTATLSSTEPATARQLSLDVADRLDSYRGIQVVSSDSFGRDQTTEDLHDRGAEFALDLRLDASALVVTLSNLTRDVLLLETRYDLERDSLAQISAEITREAARLLSPDEVPETSHRTIPQDAYRDYLIGRGKLRQPDIAAAEQSIEAFQRAAARHPRFAAAHAGMCQAFLRLYGETRATEQFEQAERHCFRSLTLASKNKETYLALGTLYRTAGRFDEARENFSNALEFDPFDSAALRGMGDVYFDMGLTEKAIGQFQAAIDVEPTSWRNYNKLGALHMSLGHYAQAAHYFEQEASYLAKHANTLNNLGAARFLTGDFEAAVAVWRESVELEPQPVTLSNIGSALFFAGQFRQALDAYREAIPLAPEDYRYWGNAGDAALFIADADADAYYMAAISLGERHLDVNATDVEALSHLATYHAALGSAETALDYLNRANAGENPDVYLVYDAAIVHARLGDNSAARRAMSQLESLGYSEKLLRSDENLKNVGYEPEG